MQLAQVNVGRLRAPAESPEIAEFVEALDRINALADRSPGFLWRLSADTSGNLDPAGVADDPLLMINLSVWASYRHLHDYTYRTAHAHYLRRRLEWFERLDPPMTALWWVDDDVRPTAAEAMSRLELLRRYGPTPQAFTVRIRFDADGRRETRVPRRSVPTGLPPV
jgi:Domain of unknown function (DUF3291)